MPTAGVEAVKPIINANDERASRRNDCVHVCVCVCVCVCIQYLKE